jgi:hypothetical protein
VTTTRNTPMPVSTAIAVVNADGNFTFDGRLAGLYLFNQPGNPARVPLSLKQVREYAHYLLAMGRVALTVEGGIPRATKS